jgi:hypothetical protein
MRRTIPGRGEDVTGRNPYRIDMYVVISGCGVGAGACRARALKDRDARIQRGEDRDEGGGVVLA